MQSVQVHCPFCNATAEPRPDGRYTCEFCLQPFSVVDAQREESRLMQEIQAWVQQKVGAVGLGGGGVDAGSRAFIFQQRILPDIKRDVDRSLETFGTFGQFALVPMPVATSRSDQAVRNPLVTHRTQILGLKNLRARLSSEHVSGFAVGPAEQSSLQSMDRRLAELVHLSNVADAASTRRPQGYTAARRNLEVLIEELDQSLATEAHHDPGLRGFLLIIRRRYQHLVELCRVSEELCTSMSAHGATLAEGVARCAGELESVAAELEGSGYSPADTMPTVVGVRNEAAAARVLVRWLQSYDVFTSRAQQPFLQFVSDVTPLLGGDGVAPEACAQRLEVAAFVLRAARGEAVAPASADTSWISGWAESQRARKSLGLFGTEEQVAGVTAFMAPVWVADVAFSRAQGSVFTSGVESRTIAIVDASSPHPSKVVFVDDPTHSIVQALGYATPLGTSEVALPLSTPEEVVPMFTQAARARPGTLNPRVNLRGIAFLAGASARYTDNKGGARTAVNCANGFVQLDGGVVHRVQATQQILQRYG